VTSLTVIMFAPRSCRRDAKLIALLAHEVLMFLRDILTVAFWQTRSVQTYSRIVTPRLFVIPKLDAFERTFAVEVDEVVPCPG
jgi:hypothetical protein